MELTHREERIVAYFSKQLQLEKVDQVRMIFGWKLFIADLKKLLIVYSLALILNCFLATLLTHASFYMIRQVAYGFHNKNIWICTIVSCMLFPLCSRILSGIEISATLNFFVYFISILPLLFFAPIGTSVNSIINDKHKAYLRRKLKFRLILITLLILFTPSTITKYLVFGIAIESISVILSIILKGVDQK
ncbi:accessory gene regulator B family protein [Bacillus sp. JZ8]